MGRHAAAIAALAFVMAAVPPARSALSQAAIAQSPSAQFPGAAASAAIASRIVLATVTDTGNRPLTDLAPDDFVVEEGGTAREVLSLHMADYPIGILLDDSDASLRDAATIRAAALRFISKMGERSVAVGTLTDPARLIVGFDAPRREAVDRIGSFTAAGGRALPLQSAAALARRVRDTGSPFAAIVILSGASVSASEAQDREFLTPILETGAPVYVVANRSAAAAQTVAPGDDDVLRAVAESTRGQYTVIYSAASYSIALDRLADRLATEMMIEYLVPGGVPSTADVRVGVKIPGARAKGLGVSK